MTRRVRLIREISQRVGRPSSHICPVQIDGRLCYVVMPHPAQTADVKDMLFLDYLKECSPVVLQTLRKIAKGAL